jgi:hypothetical protein
MDNLHSILLKTVYLSLFLQIITGIADVYVLFAVTGEKLILKALLLLEIIVQAIEGTFYVWMVSLFSTIKDVTPKRYFDWAFSTPIMLFTLCIYLDYLKKEKEEVDEKKEKYENKYNKNNENWITILFDRFNEHRTSLVPIFILNWLMLLLGYFGEIGAIDNLFAVFLGFIPFIAYYAIIYFKFARYTETGKILFWWFAIIWAFYGKAALMPYYWKNITYNILDIFSKNFFGIYLAYLVWNK